MPAPVWSPTYLPPQPGYEPIGFTIDGKPVRWSQSWYRWITEGLAPRLGGASGPGLPEIVAVLSQATVDIDALEAADVVMDARADALEADTEALQDDVAALEAEVAELTFKPSVRLDADADPPALIYRGEAEPGAAEAAAVWRIKKIEFLAGNDIKITWAGGNTNFANAWADRATLSYS